MVEVTYKGRKYKVHDGDRGGHFIKVKGEKKYVNLKQKSTGPKKSKGKKGAKKKVVKKSSGLRMPRMSNFKLFGGAVHPCNLTGLVFSLQHLKHGLNVLGNLKEPNGLCSRFSLINGNFTQNEDAQLFGRRLAPFPLCKVEHYAGNVPGQTKADQQNPFTSKVTANSLKTTAFPGNEAYENEFFKKFLTQGIMLDINKYTDETNLKFIVGGSLTTYEQNGTQLTIEPNSDIANITTHFYHSNHKNGIPVFGIPLMEDTLAASAEIYARKMLDMSQFSVGDTTFLAVSFNPVNTKPLILPCHYQVCTFIYEVHEPNMGKYQQLQSGDLTISVESIKLEENVHITPILHSQSLDDYQNFRTNLDKTLESAFDKLGHTYTSISDQKVTSASVNQSHFHGFAVPKAFQPLLHHFITIGTDTGQRSGRKSKVGVQDYIDKSKFQKHETLEGYVNEDMYVQLNPFIQKLIDTAKMNASTNQGVALNEFPNSKAVENQGFYSEVGARSSRFSGGGYYW